MVTAAATMNVAEAQFVQESSSKPAKSKKQRVEPSVAWTVSEPLGLHYPSTIDTIHLVTFSTADAILENFEDGIIDAVTNDPSSYTNIGYSASNEIRGFNTTNLH